MATARALEGRKLVVFEDNPIIKMDLERILRNAGAEVPEVKQRFVAALVLLIVSTWASQGYAANYFATGNDLYKWCQDNGAYYGECVGYVEGVLDSLEQVREYNKLKPCLHPGILAQHAVDVVLNYLEAHPELRDYVAANIVVVATGAEWGC